MDDGLDDDDGDLEDYDGGLDDDDGDFDDYHDVLEDGLANDHDSGHDINDFYI